MPTAAEPLNLTTNWSRVGRPGCGSGYLPSHAFMRPSLKALIGYSCGVLFVYHRVTTESLGSTHLIFILDMKAGDSGASALYLRRRA